jgi:methanogenic corrinoid protein MtbC1
MTFVEHVDNSSGWSGTSRQAADDSSAPATEVRPLARERRSLLLSRVVETEILPRLARARCGSAAALEGNRDPVGDWGTTDDETAALVTLLMSPDSDGAQTFIERLEARGVTPASLYLGIITAAARRLGELWEDDRCDFSVVTIGLGRLQQVIRSLSPGFQTEAVGRSAHAETALLLPAPGEQHTLGLLVLSEFFRREGWRVIGGPVSKGFDAVGLVRDGTVDVVGFSVGSSKRLDELTACISAVRKASRNRDLGIMVGGPLFLQRPELVARVGADTTAPDAPSAVRQARGLLALRTAAD